MASDPEMHFFVLKIKYSSERFGFVGYFARMSGKFPIATKFQSQPVANWAEYAEQKCAMCII